jgi:hypothetical protein
VIPVAPVPEPADFDERARKPGIAWLADHPGAARPRDLWSPFRAALAEGFAHRCGYTAMHIPDGTVDHHQSYRTSPELSYEWSNYRYVAGFVNSAKKTAVVLDPYMVQEGWFEVILPSLQLVMTDKVPAEHRALAEHTLKTLPIVHDERVLRQRRRWLAMYEASEISLAGLRKMAPLIAVAVEKRDAAVR